MLREPDFFLGLALREKRPGHIVALPAFISTFCFLYCSGSFWVVSSEDDPVNWLVVGQQLFCRWKQGECHFGVR